MLISATSPSDLQQVTSTAAELRPHVEFPQRTPQRTPLSRPPIDRQVSCRRVVIVPCMVYSSLGALRNSRRSGTRLLARSGQGSGPASMPRSPRYRCLTSLQTVPRMEHPVLRSAPPTAAHMRHPEHSVVHTEMVSVCAQDVCVHRMHTALTAPFRHGVGDAHCSSYFPCGCHERQ